MMVLVLKIPIIKHQLNWTLSSRNHINWHIHLNLKCVKWQILSQYFCSEDVFSSYHFQKFMLFHDMSVAPCLHIIISSCHVTFHKTTAAMSNHRGAEQSLFFIIKGSCCSVQIETSIYCRKVPGYWKQLLLKLVHQMLIFFSCTKC